MCLYKRTLISTITPIDSLCPIAKGKIAFFIWKSPFHASFPSSFRYDQLLYTTEDAEESWSLKHQTTLSATLQFFSIQDLQKFPMNHFLLWFPTFLVFTRVGYKEWVKAVEKFEIFANEGHSHFCEWPSLVRILQTHLL